MKNDENIVSYPNSIETRVALLEMSVSNINQTLIRIEMKMDKGFELLRIDMYKNFELSRNNTNLLRNDMNHGLNELDGEIKSIRREMRSDFRWILTFIAGLGAVMAHGFHWF